MTISVYNDLIIDGKYVHDALFRGRIHSGLVLLEANIGARIWKVRAREAYLFIWQLDPNQLIAGPQSISDRLHSKIIVLRT